MQNFNTPHEAVATPAQLFSVASSPLPRSKKLASAAPWIESGFMQLDRAFVIVAPELSATAVRAYLVHLSNVQSQGERPNSSSQYRENAADKMGRDKTTWDKGNAELFRRGMVVKSPRRARNGSQEWHLTPPSEWLFDSLKNASTCTKKCVQADAKMRRITKETQKKTLKTNSASAFVVETDSPKFVSGPTAPITNAEQALIEIGVSQSVAANLAENIAEPQILQQIAWLDARRPRSRPAILVKAIRENWCAPDLSSHDKVGKVGYQSPKPPLEVQNGSAYQTWHPTGQVHDINEETTASSEPPQDIFPVEAHAVFQNLPESEQERLRQLARQDVDPEFWDRLERPESPMALVLWEIVARECREEYARQLE